MIDPIAPYAAAVGVQLTQIGGMTFCALAIVLLSISGVYQAAVGRQTSLSGFLVVAAVFAIGLGFGMTAAGV